jgi:hypothetical protein
VPEKTKKFMSNLDRDSLTSLRLSGTVDAVSIGVSGAEADGRSPIGQVFTRDGKERWR